MRAFQQARGLDSDGIVGPDTARALDAARWRIGDRILRHVPGHLQSGDDVLQLQRQLLRLGVFTGRADGWFGPDTERGLREPPAGRRAAPGRHLRSGHAARPGPAQPHRGRRERRRAARARPGALHRLEPGRQGRGHRPRPRRVRPRAHRSRAGRGHRRARPGPPPRGPAAGHRRHRRADPRGAPVAHRARARGAGRPGRRRRVRLPALRQLDRRPARRRPSRGCGHLLLGRSRPVLGLRPGSAAGRAGAARGRGAHRPGRLPLAPAHLGAAPGHLDAGRPGRGRLPDQPRRRPPAGRPRLPRHRGRGPAGRRPADVPHRAAGLDHRHAAGRRRDGDVGGRAAAAAAEREPAGLSPTRARAPARCPGSSPARARRPRATTAPCAGRAAAAGCAGAAGRS